MSELITEKSSFVKGAVRNTDLGYVVCSNDKLSEERAPHSIYVQWDEGQFADIETKPWYTAGVCVVTDSGEQMLAVGEYGDVVVFGSGEHFEEKIPPENGETEIRGPLRAVRTIGDHAYAVGMKRQVYRRDSKMHWSAIDRGMTPKPGSDVVGFEAIDGYGDDNLYAVGWEGEIWRFDGAGWRFVPSPCNLILTDVCCAGDDNVYICGQVGTLIRGKEDQWEIIDLDDLSDDLWSLAWYNDELYVATMKQVYRLSDDQLVPVDMGPDTAWSCYQLSVRNGLLWSIGAKDLFSYDGSLWQRLA